MPETPTVSSDDSSRLVRVTQEVAFSLALDKAVYTVNPTASSPPQMTAALVFRSTVSPPVVLEFFSYQRFDLLIINDAGDEVYQWSAGQIFPMIAENIPVTGEESMCRLPTRRA